MFLSTNKIVIIIIIIISSSSRISSKSPNLIKPKSFCFSFVFFLVDIFINSTVYEYITQFQVTSC